MPQPSGYDPEETAEIGTDAGYVYVLTNPVMPDLIKIGIARDVAARMRSLYQSGVPVPFECFYAKHVASCRQVEAALHKAFDPHRVNKSREFFRLDPECARAILDVMPGEELDLSEDAGAQDENDVAALNREQRRAEQFNFGMVHIPPGAVLTWVRDPAMTCTVHNNKSVEFEGKIVSLSDAARILFARAGSKQRAFRGPLYWQYKGKTLQELRMEQENADEDAE
ncbi:GIY-YIG nuclease family protein [Acetobacter oryzoeni]|uniref:GIY-YIG nuclease family protein n=1 Tax=Acetobacter oryzoeni TaxID=2500548 RepID=A0A5B9GIT7_9PROT|nr:GIY-YIG nuclease family protein [Acetobacter oryzoeni]MCP1201857.1 GIY-YIG nuclease family protein [Acetobacter oryzoeni]QEE84646.1 GIY-YIG nuclease family protein [Acetobacter oryzoeni]